jgi:hypothetical protein
MYIGTDVLGPWEVTAPRTRGVHANSKRWAVIFTCFSTRAIHIELVGSMRGHEGTSSRSTRTVELISLARTMN